MITTYAELQTAVADWLLRTDLTSVIPTFIDLAEARMKRDPRLRRLTRTDPFTIDGESVTLPTDFAEVESLYLDGDNSRYGEIEIASAGSLGDLQNLYGPTGVPRRASIVDQTTLVFAPVPDQDYDAVLTYWATFVPLDSGANTTNWVLTNHPDVYLYGTLVQSAPYTLYDERVPVWQGLYDTAMEEVFQDTKRGQYGGSLVRRATHPIP